MSSLWYNFVDTIGKMIESEEQKRIRERKEFEEKFKPIKEFVNKLHSYPQIYSIRYSLENVSMNIIKDPENPLTLIIPETVGTAKVTATWYEINIPEDIVKTFTFSELHKDSYTQIQHDCNVRTGYDIFGRYIEYSGGSGLTISVEDSHLTLLYPYYPPDSMSVGYGLVCKKRLPFLCTNVIVTLRTKKYNSTNSANKL